MDDINTKFENVDAVALDALEEVLLTPLESVYELEKHVARLTRYIMISNNSGFPIEEYRQVRIFRTHLPQISAGPVPDFPHVGDV
jgi:hypothetical protein